MAETMSSGDNPGERNPFAPPPADAPDQPWQPRTPRSADGGDGPGGEGPARNGGGWQPRPPAPQPPRLDPTDPAHRKARNAALAGLFALICVLAGVTWVALFAGVLGIVWGISAMRSPRPAPAVGAAPAGPNPLTPAALAGVLTGAMTVVVASSVIGLGLYYDDYVTCVRDSLTTVGAENCSRLAPQWYVDLVGNGQN